MIRTFKTSIIYSMFATSLLFTADAADSSDSARGNINVSDLLMLAKNESKYTCNVTFVFRSNTHPNEVCLKSVALCGFSETEFEPLSRRLLGISIVTSMLAPIGDSRETYVQAATSHVDSEGIRSFTRIKGLRILKHDFSDGGTPLGIIIGSGIN